MKPRGVLRGAVAVLVIWGLWFWLGLGFSFAFLALSVILLLAFLQFEQSDPPPEGVVLIATLSAVAAASRVPFAVLPSVQPVTFLIILIGVVFGRPYGFIVGAIAAFVSNLVLGQGPWTPWQMLAWGSIGWLAGLVAPFLKKSKGALVAFGLISGFFFGWFMNVWVALTAGAEVFLPTWILFCVASFPMDLAHAISTVLLLLFFGTVVEGIFQRLQQKYKIR